MLIPLVLGSVFIVVNMGIQVMAVVILIGYFMRKMSEGGFEQSFRADTRILGIVLAVLFAGHIVQFATWAILFVFLGEFPDFNTAFYHSTVNFASLGYGDLVTQA